MMRKGGTRRRSLHGLLMGISGLSLLMPLLLPGLARAAIAPASGEPSGAPASPPARSERLNPTGRRIALTIPARDGSTYLGDLGVTIGTDDAITFPTERALQLLQPTLAPDVFEALRTKLAGKPAIGPDEFASAGIGTVYDSQKLELRFEIPVEKRASRSVSVSPIDRAAIGTRLKPANFSAYLNMRGLLDLVESGPLQGLASPILLFNGAARIGRVVAESDAIVSPGNSGAAVQRLGSRLVYDDLKDLVRVTVGDLQTQGRGFQTAPDIAGISIMRSYSVLNPGQIIRPRGDQSFQLQRASTVEVIVNGQQVRRLQLAPGNYNLRDFPFAQGANDIRLNVLDDTGRNETLRFNVFLDQTQLARGLSEFGIYAGVRAPLGPRGPVYSNDWVASGFYRRGLNDYLTLGANFQADKMIQMGGLETVIATPFGALGGQAAFSTTRGIGQGYALQATFQRLIQHPGGQADTFNLFAERRSHRFAPVSFVLPNNPYQYEVGGGYSYAFNAAFYAGFDGRYSRGRGTTPDVHNYRVSSGYRLSSTASVTTEARYSRDSLGRQVSGFITLTMRLGRYSSVRTEYDTRDNRARASFQTLHGSGVGSYNVSADFDRSDLGGDIQVNANYLANRAELGLSHFGVFSRAFSSSLQQRTSFRLGTSIAIADGSVSVGRPIYDSFAIVKPHPSLGRADVIVEPTPYGYTANSGALRAATMPGLSSYSERNIAVDVANAPAGTDIGQGSFKVFPAYRSGYVFEVGSANNVTALGTMIGLDGQPVALVSGTATEVRHPDHPPVTLFTNRIGRFGATGLAPGQWRLEMLDDAKSVFLIDIPKDAHGVVRLGEIKPVKDQ